MATTNEAEGVKVSCAFDSGNCVLRSASADLVRVGLRPDPYTKGTDEKSHAQWFFFKVSNLQPSKTVAFEIVDLEKVSSYPSAWPGYQTAFSYDLTTWNRVWDTTYSEGTLSWSLTPMRSQVYFAYFAPYSYARHQKLIQKCDASPMAQVRVLGSTLDGRDIEMVTVGTGKLCVWINCRQHPGESMAEWLAEGLLERLLDDSDPIAAELRDCATIRCVPNMNPDGSVRGYLRTNAGGANLNREWADTGDYKAPTLERSPEVFWVLKELDTVGCDLYVDVHGDEEIPANFFASTRGIPGWSERLDSLFVDFQNELVACSPDFQTKLGYGDDEPGKANLAICADQIAQRFDCLAVTLEQPFKDSHQPMPHCGWSPERSKALGSALLNAIRKMVPKLELKAKH